MRQRARPGPRQGTTRVVLFPSTSDKPVMDVKIQLRAGATSIDLPVCSSGYEKTLPGLSLTHRRLGGSRVSWVVVRLFSILTSLFNYKVISETALETIENALAHCDVRSACINYNPVKLS
ncbi:hypothetical protein ElyMa_001801200 [Elysia marginata]|uniref:Uncharacterized protein n=1 Tax=Elysia marginata TaxID=1093978 RepID=A0AAV4EG10_9GAST|nr:hypothetical protein ElyMa_001801200 [Elysia marginata]